jgi:hypothetical protein
MFEYKLNPCHEVSDSRCSTSAAALQMNSRGCSVLGQVSSRSVSELHRLIEGGVGISFLLGGGSLCYNKSRSVRIDVTCADIDVDTVSSISEGRSVSSIYEGRSYHVWICSNRKITFRMPDRVSSRRAWRSLWGLKARCLFPWAWG